MNRQAPNVNLDSTADAAAWYLLAEFSPQEFLSDRSRSDGFMAGLLSLPHQEMDTLPEWLAPLETLLARFAKEVVGQFEQSGRVRVFCQRKIIEDAYLERAASQLDPGKKMNGGWGYYAIEKGRDFTDAAWTEPCHIIEIYVYRESIARP